MYKLGDFRISKNFVNNELIYKFEISDDDYFPEEYEDPFNKIDNVICIHQAMDQYQPTLLTQSPWMALN